MLTSIGGEDLYQWKQWATQLAQSNGVDPYEAEWLLQGLTTLTPLSIQLDLYREHQDISCSLSLSQLTKQWKARVFAKVPVQYLVGETPWRNFSITVTPDVLIPRPETELIIDLAKTLATQNHHMAKQRHLGNWADLGTGSGAIALGLADTFEKAAIHAVDVSASALDVARRNAEDSFLSDRIFFYQGSWFSPLSSLKGQLAGMVSNPPYIPSKIISSLQPEVALHEPHLALDGGTDGFLCIQRLVAEGAEYLQPGGLWLIELMCGQAKAVVRLLKSQESYTDIVIHQDLSGTERFVSAYKVL